MTYKIGEIVLVDNGHGGYMARSIVSVHHFGCNLLCGSYSTFYKFKDIHKCPKSIKDIIKVKKKTKLPEPHCCPVCKNK